MSDKQERLVGNPSDYGGRTLADEEAELSDEEETSRTADGEPLRDRGIADSAMSGDENAASNE